MKKQNNNRRNVTLKANHKMKRWRPMSRWMTFNAKHFCRERFAEHSSSSIKKASKWK